MEAALEQSALPAVTAKVKKAALKKPKTASLKKAKPVAKKAAKQPKVVRPTESQKALAKAIANNDLTIKDLIKVLGVSDQTVYNWRVRSADALPTYGVVTGGTTRVFAKLSAVKAWAKKWGITLVEKEVRRFEK